jgi:hypothetical protein
MDFVRLLVDASNLLIPVLFGTKWILRSVLLVISIFSHFSYGYRFNLPELTVEISSDHFEVIFLVLLLQWTPTSMLFQKERKLKRPRTRQL